MSLLILLRHGQSVWNAANRFTGWVDVPLSEQGVTEAIQAGKEIQDIPIDIIYTSTLIRAQHTAMLAMTNHSSKQPPILHHEEEQLKSWGHIYAQDALDESIPVYCNAKLNERMYGELQGLNKKETMEKFGEEQVKIWRRSYDTPPPKGESLKDTSERTLPYFRDTIVKSLDQGLNILVSAHGNSLRSIMMELDGLSPEQVVSLEIPTGKPILYSYSEGVFTKEEIETPQI